MISSSELESPKSKSKSSRTSNSLGAVLNWWQLAAALITLVPPFVIGTLVIPPPFFLLMLSYPLFVIGNPCHTLPLILVLMSPPSFVIGVFVTPYLCYWCLCHPMPLLLVPLSPLAFVIGNLATPFDFGVGTGNVIICQNILLTDDIVITNMTMTMDHHLIRDVHCS